MAREKEAQLILLIGPSAVVAAILDQGENATFKRTIQYMVGQCAVLSIFISRGQGQAVSENIHFNNLAPASGIVGYDGSDTTILIS